MASQLEDSYLFPLDDRKIVTAAFGSGFSYFGFVTLFFTVLGGATYTFGLILGLSFLDESGSGWTLGYLGSLFAATALAVTVGWWWFVGGEGERRLRSVLDSQFPPQMEDQ